MWKNNLGVEVALNQKSANQITSDDSGGGANSARDQLFTNYWVADYPDPHDWTTLLWHSGASYNTTGFNSPNFDALVDKADLEPDGAKRLHLYHDAEQILEAQVALIPLDNNLALMRISPHVHGFLPNAFIEVPPSAWAHVYLTP
jgi:peptide/nickel transport system substrate-binding protein/oligopeptide transport system substrate-binding protein